MEVEQKKEKAPMSKESIYRLMLILVFGVASLFLVKNAIGKNITAVVVIGVCLAVFAIVIFVLHKLKVQAVYRQLFVSLGIMGVIFLISMFSGESLSDDFLLYMAVLGLAGMYLMPKLTLIQIVVADALLVLLAVLQPQKAGEMGQYILCLAVFTLAAVLMYLVIKRGRAYIAMSDEKTEEAVQLIGTLTDIGEEIHNNFKKSTESYEGLHVINEQLRETAKGLRAGSEEILAGTEEVVDVCEDMHEKILITGEHIKSLNEDVNHFEASLNSNQDNMEEMAKKMEYVQKSMKETSAVFRMLEEQMQQISAVTEQLNKIASSTNMLALNASIEAARAGKMGEGFAVVASKVQDLAVDSNRCSAQVAEVVGAIQEQLKKTIYEVEDSENAIEDALGAAAELREGCMQLTNGFSSLYNNIAAQNDNVGAIDAKFEQLKSKVTEMSSFSQENQNAVVSITDAITAYKDNMQQVIKDSSCMSEVSEEMLSAVVKK